MSLIRSVAVACIILLGLLAGCTSEAEPQMPTPVAAAPTLASPQETTASGVPPTWTAAPTPVETGDEASGATFTPRPSATPLILPSNTPTASATPADTATSSATPTETATVTPTSPPLQSQNLLPNPSFEGGWYHIGGEPELQVPEQWDFNWEHGPNPLPEDPAPWVRPEIRVLPEDFLPADEHDVFIWDGEQTVKIFKGSGAISFQLTTELTLQPGTYLLQINVFPDLVDHYEEGQKVWAPDPLSGEVRLVAGAQSTGWMLPEFGRKNSFSHTFRLDGPEVIRVGAAMRGRWAIENNGWFMDDWGLYRVGD